MSRTITVISENPVVCHAATLIGRIFPQPRVFSVRLWDGTILPTTGTSTFSLAINHPGALRRMFKPPVELSLGEAFILNDFDIEGDIFSAFPLMESIANRPLSIGEIISIGLDLSALPATGRARM